MQESREPAESEAKSLGIAIYAAGMDSLRRSMITVFNNGIRFESQDNAPKRSQRKGYRGYRRAEGVMALFSEIKSMT